MKHYDLVVVGAGSSGIMAAESAARHGLRVALIEEKCLLGNDSKRCRDIVRKSFFDAAATIYHARSFSKVYEDLNLNAVIELANCNWRRFPKDKIIAKLLELPVDIYYQKAQFLNNNKLQVGNRCITADKFILAPGSGDYHLDVQISDSVQLLTPNNILSLEKLPKKIIVIGVSAESLEYAQSFVRLGADVTIIIDTFTPKWLLKALANLSISLGAEGIKFCCDVNVKKISGSSKRSVTLCESSDGSEFHLYSDAVFIGSHKFDGASLGLHKANVRFSESGIEADNYLQTTEQHIFAVGASLANEVPYANSSSMASIALHNVIFPFIKRKLSVADKVQLIRTEPGFVNLTPNSNKRLKTWQSKIHNYSSLNLQHEHLEIKWKVRGDRVVGFTAIGNKIEDSLNILMQTLDPDKRVWEFANLPYINDTCANYISMSICAYQPKLFYTKGIGMSLRFCKEAGRKLSQALAKAMQNIRAITPKVKPVR